MTYKVEIAQDELAESPRMWDNLGTMVCAHRNYDLGDVSVSCEAEMYFAVEDAIENSKMCTDLAAAWHEFVAWTEGDCPDDCPAYQTCDDHGTYDGCVLAKNYPWYNPEDYSAHILRWFEEFLISAGHVVLTLYLYDHSGLSMSTSETMYRAIDSAAWDWGKVGFIFCTRQRAMQAFGATEWSDELERKVEEVLRAEVEEYNTYLQGDVYVVTVYDDEGNVVEAVGTCYGYEEAERVAGELLTNLTGGDEDDN